MRRKNLHAALSASGHAQLRAVERIEIDLAVLADNAELVSRHVRVPAHVNYTVHPTGKLH